MSWLAQVRHVLTKDVRESRWWLGAFAALVALAVAGAFDWVRLVGNRSGFVMAGVLITGLLTAAAVVQSDSPTRSDAFWAVHPLRPSAVLGAKTSLALLLFAFGLIGQAVAARAYHAPWSEMPWLLARSAPVFGASLLAAMVLASVLRELRSFLLAGLLVPIGCAIVIQWLSSDGQREPARTTYVALAALGAAGGLALLAWLYRTRDARDWARAAGIGFSTSAIFSAAALPNDWVSGEERATLPVPFTLALTDDALHNDEQGLRARLRYGALPENLRLALGGGTLRVRLRDGSTMQLFAYAAPDVDPSAIPAPHIAGVRWLDSASVRPSEFLLQAPLTPAQRRALASGVSAIAALTFAGTVSVTEGRMLTTLPIVPGAEWQRDGLRVRIEERESDMRPSAVLVRTTEVGRRAEGLGIGDRFGHPTLGAALVNASRGEALRLYGSHTSFGGDGLVLPGAPFRSAVLHFSPDRTGRSAMVVFSSARSRPASPPVPPPPSPLDEGEVVDAAWLRDARLAILWEEYRGSAPVRAELRLP